MWLWFLGSNWDGSHIGIPFLLPSTELGKFTAGFFWGLCALRAHAVAFCQHKRETIKESYLSLVYTSVNVHCGHSVRGRVRPRRECRTCCLLLTSARPCSRPPFVGLLRRAIAISKVRVCEGETARGRVDVPTASRLRYLLWRNTFHVGRVSDVSNVKCRLSATHRLGTTGMRSRGAFISSLVSIRSDCTFPKAAQFTFVNHHNPSSKTARDTEFDRYGR